ncbi:hypothetical protein GCM10010269_75890 [Streptomyces humidus]|uniref:Uncharacterized protein n=1 Tax=Streptomyces humidus TaxID=52259 RepID=A0A918GCN7_9ACTN|nr:hypothetical protein GCM10010269_75890 [Streptomyces humidus]
MPTPATALRPRGRLRHHPLEQLPQLVRQSAIEALQAEGIVQGVQGKGVFVIAVPADPPENDKTDG